MLVVEDDRNILEAVRGVISQPESGMRVAAAFDRAGDAVAWLRGKGSVRCALVDLGLPDRPGTEVLAALRAERRGVSVTVSVVLEVGRTWKKRSGP